MNNNSDKRQEQNKEEDDSLQIYGPGGSTLQTPEEHQLDQSIDPRKDNTMDVANDDLRETDIDRLRNNLDGSRGNADDGDSQSDQ